MGIRRSGMKKLILAAIAALLVFSCAINTADSGRLVLSLPSAEKGLIDHTIDYSKTYLKLWILQDGVPLSFFGKGGLMMTPPILRTEVVFDLPANEGTSAPSYQAVIAFHEDPNANTSADDKIFHEDAYGISDSFYISAGVDTSIPIKIKLSPFKVLSDTAGSSVAVVENESVDDLYVLSGQNLRMNTGAAAPLPLSGVSAYSVSKGHWFSGATAFVEEPWLNTSDGIYRKVGQVWTPLMAEKDRTIVKNSTAIHMKFLEGDTADNLIIFYLNGKLDAGGVASFDSASARSDDPAKWTWIKVLDSIDKPDFAALKPYTDTIKGDLLTSYVLRENFILAVTPLGTVRVGKDLIKVISDANTAKTKIDADWAINNVLKNSEYFLTVSGRTIDNVASAGAYTFVGTENGLYYSTIDEANGKVSGSFTLIEDTKNKKVVTLGSVKFGTAVFTAAAFSDGSLAIFQNASLWKPIYPSYSGVAANPRSIAWQREAGSLNLVIAGDDVVKYAGIK
jgi:hypothetical protein